MTQIRSYKRTEYPNGDIVLTGISSLETRELATYKKVVKYADGSGMDDSKLDPIVYRKLGTEYFLNSIVTEKGSISASFFGVKGDGETDDTFSIQLAYTIASLFKKTIDQRGLTIKISSKITINSSVRILGGEIITSQPVSAEVIEVNGSYISFDSVTFNFNENNNYGINIKSGSKTVTFSDCNVKDLKEVVGNGVVTCGVRVETGCAGVKIKRTEFKNITPIENGSVGDTAGAARAILIGKVDNCVIDNCDFTDIRGFEDGDCIHVQTSLVDNSWGFSDVSIINNRFHNIYKRAVKLQCSGGYIYNNKITSLSVNSLCTFAAISIFGQNSKVLDNEINMLRATCVIELGSINILKGVEIKRNSCRLNYDNLYTSTASTSILSFIKLNATSGGEAVNLFIDDNTFNGHARAIYLTANSTTDFVFFRRNICEFSSIYQDSGVSVNAWEISGNEFIGNGNLSSHGGADSITLTNPNEVLIQKNTFKRTNGYKLRVSGVVGTSGVEMKDSTIISPNSLNYIHSSNVTTGANRIVSSLSQQRTVMEGVTPPSIANQGDSFFNINPGVSKIFGWSCTNSSAGEVPATWDPINTASAPVESVKIKGPNPTSGSALPLLNVQGADGVSRFLLGKRSLESGANSGSNLVLFAYPDGGGAPLEVMSFLRSNGYVGLGISTPSENLDVSGKVRARGGFILGSTEITRALASADVATVAAGATPTKAEFDTLLNELRDLKTKLRTSKILIE